ncbi:MAG: hypothetical protein ACK5HT_06340, partial [Draconibacterium sp.]
SAASARFFSSNVIWLTSSRIFCSPALSSQLWTLVQAVHKTTDRIRSRTLIFKSKFNIVQSISSLIRLHKDNYLIANCKISELSSLPGKAVSILSGS